MEPCNLKQAFNGTIAKFSLDFLHNFMHIVASVNVFRAPLDTEKNVPSFRGMTTVFHVHTLQRKIAHAVAIVK